ncbi:MAG: hypothetical protein IH626_12970, partial [Rhodospirillales bacterium]|nr:hypothetical protein [Rhodospirillales bacterium]
MAGRRQGGNLGIVDDVEHRRRRLVRVSYANLVNLVLDRPAVPELLQEDCRPERLTVALDALLADETA